MPILKGSGPSFLFVSDDVCIYIYLFNNSFVYKSEPRLYIQIAQGPFLA